MKIVEQSNRIHIRHGHCVSCNNAKVRQNFCHSKHTESPMTMVYFNLNLIQRSPTRWNNISKQSKVGTVSTNSALDPLRYIRHRNCNQNYYMNLFRSEFLLPLFFRSRIISSNTTYRVHGDIERILQNLRHSHHILCQQNSTKT